MDKEVQISHVSPTPIHTKLLTTSHIPKNDMFVISDKPTLTHHKHSKSIIIFWFTLGVAHFVSLDKCIHHYGLMQNIFIVLIFLCIPP